MIRVIEFDHQYGNCDLYKGSYETLEDARKDILPRLENKILYDLPMEDAARLGRLLLTDWLEAVSEYNRLNYHKNYIEISST